MKKKKRSSQADSIRWSRAGGVYSSDEHERQSSVARQTHINTSLQMYVNTAIKRVSLERFLVAFSSKKIIIYFNWGKVMYGNFTIRFQNFPLGKKAEFLGFFFALITYVEFFNKSYQLLPHTIMLTLYFTVTQVMNMLLVCWDPQKLSNDFFFFFFLWEISTA